MVTHCVSARQEDHFESGEWPMEVAVGVVNHLESRHWVHHTFNSMQSGEDNRVLNQELLYRLRLMRVAATHEWDVEELSDQVNPGVPWGTHWRSVIGATFWDGWGSYRKDWRWGNFGWRTHGVLATKHHRAHQSCSATPWGELKLKLKNEGLL